MTETVQFRSANMQSASYDDQTQDLMITFQSGDSYLYRSVPYEVWHGLQHAQSAGAYFHRQIKNRYAYERT